MNVLALTLFVSIGLVALLLLGFVKMIRDGDIDHADRLSLLPLEDDVMKPPPEVEDAKPDMQTATPSQTLS